MQMTWQGADICCITCAMRSACEPGVNFVEDDGGQTFVARQYGFQRQHETGYFTARSNEAYVLLGHVLVGRKEQRHVVGTRGVGLLARRELQRHTGMRHAQGLEQCHKVGR